MVKYGQVWSGRFHIIRIILFEYRCLGEKKLQYHTTKVYICGTIIQNFLHQQ